MTAARGRRTALAVASLLVVATSVGAAAADRGALQRACFAPSELQSQPAERRIVRAASEADRGPPSIELAAVTPVPRHLRGAIRRVELPPGRKLVALTFDFCEQAGEIAGYDGAIVDYLRSQGVKATLFVGGHWLMTHRARAEQLMLDPLLEIASHGWAHRNVRLLQGGDLERELLGPSRAYEHVRAGVARKACLAAHASALGHVAPRITLFRFPFGACNRVALDAVADAGQLAVQWDVSTGDSSPGQSARAIADTILRAARPGSIILAHANGRGHHTAAALPLVVPALRARGFELVTVSELLAAGRPVIAESCYDARPGDTDKYDALGRAFGRNAGAGGGWSTTTLSR